MTEVKVFINGVEREGTQWVSGHWGDVYITAVGETFEDVINGEVSIKNGDSFIYSILLKNRDEMVENEERTLFFLQLWKKHKLHAHSWHSCHDRKTKEYYLTVCLSYRNPNTLTPSHINTLEI